MSWQQLHTISETINFFHIQKCSRNVSRNGTAYKTSEYILFLVPLLMLMRAMMSDLVMCIMALLMHTTHSWTKKGETVG